VYWIGWCGVVPAVLIGRRHLIELFTRRPAFRTLDLPTRLLLLWPIVFPLVFAFIPRVRSAGAPVILISIALGVVIGITEEALWRGVYATLFDGNARLAVIYPSIGFAMWHVCPLSVLPSRYPGGAASFTVYSLALGLSYANCARRTRSIFWCTVSHCVHDALGLGGFAYVGLLQR
jgi:membrane protease YdiL (CAAX protease family)